MFRLHDLRLPRASRQSFNLHGSDLKSKRAETLYHCFVNRKTIEPMTTSQAKTSQRKEGASQSSLNDCTIWIRYQTGTWPPEWTSLIHGYTPLPVQKYAQLRMPPDRCSAETELRNESTCDSRWTRYLSILKFCKLGGAYDTDILT